MRETPYPVSAGSTDRLHSTAALGLGDNQLRGFGGGLRIDLSVHRRIVVFHRVLDIVEWFKLAFTIHLFRVRMHPCP